MNIMQTNIYTAKYIQIGLPVLSHLILNNSINAYYDSSHFVCEKTRLRNVK